jgi:hypothetical protein
MHLLSSMSSRIVFRWLPDEDFVSSTLDSFVGNAYVYGREWISSKVMKHPQNAI